jgi:hypothetical protein
MVRGFLGVAAILSSVLGAVSAHASPNPAGLWLSLSAQYQAGPWLNQWGGFVILNVPLDRMAQPRVPAARPVFNDEPRLTEEPPKKQSDAAPTLPPAPPAKKRDPFVPLLTPQLARGTVRHALAVAGYYSARTRLSSLSGRARSSAVLPELRLRTLRSTGQTLRLTPTDSDPYQYTQAGTSELLFEARLTWHLDRLVFSDQEVSIERLQNERDAAERKLVDHVLERLTSWQRSRVRAADEDSEPEVRETAELEALGAAVELDVLTDGWFSQVIGERDEPEPALPSEKPKPEVDTPRHAR